MELLTISVATISANAPAIILSAGILSIVVLAILAIDDIQKKHILEASDYMVHETAWNNQQDGVSADGVPYYGSLKDTSENR